MNRKENTLKNRAFTIVEIVVVIAVIGILAAIITISYNAIRQSAKDRAVAVDLQSTSVALKKYRSENGAYPSSANFGSAVTATSTSGATYSYTHTPASDSYCLEAVLQNSTFHMLSSSAETLEGACPEVPIANGSHIQTITTANCPTTRTRAVDARDNRTYWVQKLADNECWMLTNLAYAGGGTNTYGDTRTLINGTGGATSYTAAHYYIPTSGSNVTTEPTAPSTSSAGSGQYGYLYNWCGAMGGQATAACANATTPALNTAVSVCPAGWALPTINEFTALNTSINGGTEDEDAGLLSTWLAQYSGGWATGFGGQGAEGRYWSREQASAPYANLFLFASSLSSPADIDGKHSGSAVRCIAS